MAQTRLRTGALSGITSSAFWGELFSTAALARGAAGAVMDGYVRDVRRVAQLGFPLFAAGLRPINSKGPCTVAAYDVPVRCGVMLVHPGDLIFGEIDGVVVVPQAKVHNGSCALGPAIVVAAAGEMRDLPIALGIERSGQEVFAGDTRTSQMKRSLKELATCLRKELDFASGALLMTGTGIVPGESFTLRPGDRVRVKVGTLDLENETEG